MISLNTNLTAIKMNFFLSCQGGLQKLLQYIKDKDPDKVSVCLASTLDTIAQMELLQVFMNSFVHSLVV